MTTYEFHTIHYLYYHDLFPPMKPALPLPNHRFDAYFAERGITQAMIDEAGVVPITRHPLPKESAIYQEYLKEPRKNIGTGEPDPVLEGILWPYFVNEDTFGKFGRLRAFTWQKDYVSWCQRKGKEVPKCLSPKKSKVKASSHLYILPKERGKLQKSSTVILLIEGEAKTLKLVQDARLIASEVTQYAVVGISGVSQLLSAPEFNEIQWRNRQVVIFFDADSERKYQVAQEELKITAHLFAKGVRSVKSAVWSEKRGKGYDDYSVNGERANMPATYLLRKLLKQAVTPFEKYAPTEDTDGYPLDLQCRAMAKAPLQPYQKASLIEQLYKLYRPQGIKKKDIQRLFDQESENWQHEQQQQQLQENAELVKETFGTEKPPLLPKDFLFHYGNLSFADTPLCRMFVISKYISNDNQDEQDYYLASFQNKEVMIPSGDFTNYRKIAEIFNRNREILHDSSARLVQRYISEYWISNRHNIPISYYYQNTGWDKDGIFRLPSLDSDGFYDFEMQQTFTKSGTCEEQKALFREVLTQHNAGIKLLLGFAAPLTGLFNLPNYVINIYGNPGEGKTTGAVIALSAYGNPRKLLKNMNSTRVGREAALSVHKDLPVLLDEVNTGGNGDGKQIAQQLIETIYGFDSGKGRTRSNIKITVRKMNEYKGLLFLTSERSLESIFSVSKNLNVGGAYRRTLEIPVVKHKALWNYPDSNEKEFFNDLYERLYASYGHLGPEWIYHISNRDNQADIKQRYTDEIKQFGEDWNLKGTENLICLLKAITPDIERLLDLPDGSIMANLDGYLTDILQHQQAQINHQVRDQVDRFIESLEDFISLNPTAFDGVCPENLAMTRVYGRVIHGDKKTHVYLRPQALTMVCNDYGFNKDGILTRLHEEGRFEPRFRTIKQDGKTQVIEVPSFQMKINNTNGRVYHFVLPTSKEYEDEELVPAEDSQDEMPFSPERSRNPWR